MTTLTARSVEILRICEEHTGQVFTYASIAKALDWQIGTVKKWVYPLLRAGCLVSVESISDRTGPDKRGRLKRAFVVTEVGKMSLLTLEKEGADLEAFEYVQRTVISQEAMRQAVFTVLNYCQDRQCNSKQYRRLDFTYPQVSRGTGLDIGTVRICVCRLVERRQFKFVDGEQATFALKGYHQVVTYNHDVAVRIQGWEDPDEIEEQIKREVNP